jgi:hypothetical protein
MSRLGKCKTLEVGKVRGTVSQNEAGGFVFSVWPVVPVVPGSVPQQGGRWIPWLGGGFCSSIQSSS